MFTVCFFTDHGCCYGSAHLYVNANACLYLQTQLLFYMEKQRRRTARRSTVFLQLSLPRCRYIACQRRRLRFWIRPGRTAVWWENFEKEVVFPEEWHENFRMSRSSLLSLSELLHPSIAGRIYAGSCKQKLV